MKPPHDKRPGGGRPPAERGQSRGPGQPNRPHTSGGPRREQNVEGGRGPRADRPQGGQGQGFGRGEHRPGGPGRAFAQGEHRQGGQGGRGFGQGERREGGHAGGENRPRPQGQGFRDRQEGRPFRDRPEREGGPRNQEGGYNRDRQPGPYRDRQDGGRQDRPRHEGGQYHRDRPRPQQFEQRRGPEAPHGTLWLYGQHAVAAALANPARRLRRLLLTEEAEVALAVRLPPPWPLQPERTERARLDQMLGRDIAHQGAALLADPLPTPSLQQVLERPGPIIVLDQVTDPRNVGAILRTAAAFGAAAVITQDRNAPEETGALAKAASGALETMPLLRAVNIARTLIALKAANVWCVGLDTGGAPLAGHSLAGRRIALVLGAEGEGLRRLTRETCDEIAGLQMPGARGLLDSLNVSAATAVALYEVTRSEGSSA